MLLLNPIGRSFHNGSLWAKSNTVSAADTGVCDLIPILRNFPISNRVTLPENGVDPKMKVFYGHIRDSDNDADVTGVSGIYIFKIRLFLKNQITPLILFIGRNRRCCS